VSAENKRLYMILKKVHNDSDLPAKGTVLLAAPGNKKAPLRQGFGYVFSMDF
jgi:hypothetical protein